MEDEFHIITWEEWKEHESKLHEGSSMQQSLELMQILSQSSNN